MQIQVTEFKSKGQLRGNNTVRVFVNRDFSYGYFVDEQALFDLLTSDQQTEYLARDDVRLEVPVDVAQKIVDMGQTIYQKPQLT